MGEEQPPKHVNGRACDKQCDVSRMIKNPDNLARGSGQCLVDFTNGGSDTTQHLRYLIGNWATPLIYPGSRNVGCSGRRCPPSFPPRAKIINHTGQAAPRIHLHLSPTVSIGLLLSRGEEPAGNSDIHQCLQWDEAPKISRMGRKRGRDGRLTFLTPCPTSNTRGKKFGYKRSWRVGQEVGHLINPLQISSKSGPKQIRVMLEM